jgi:hypothetical protein
MDVRYYSMLCTSLVGVFCDVVDVVGNVRFPNFTIEEVRRYVNKQFDT